MENNLIKKIIKEIKNLNELNIDLFNLKNINIKKNHNGKQAQNPQTTGCVMSSLFSFLVFCE